MTKSKFLFFLSLSCCLLFFFENCAQSPSSSSPSLSLNCSSPSLPAALPILGTESNVVPLLAGCSYGNEPCVSVTVCEPGTSNCTTVNNVLLDTGSYGLRLFQSTIASLNLTQVVTTIGSNHLAECVK